jgi:hypothetical protein
MAEDDDATCPCIPINHRRYAMKKDDWVARRGGLLCCFLGWRLADDGRPFDDDDVIYGGPACGPFAKRQPLKHAPSQ